MAQAGIHSMVGVAVRKWSPARQWLVLGIVLGSLLPDADNLAVAIATMTGGSTEGLHRTITHSLITATAVVIVFQLIGRVSKRPSWGNLGLGLGIGVALHALLDLLIWFDGVQLFWPLPLWVNLWAGVTPPEWFSQLMMPMEMLFFALYFGGLVMLAQRQGTDLGRMRSLKVWTAVQTILFLIFLALVYTMESGFMTIYGVVYLLSLGLAVVITVRMRQTIESAAQSPEEFTQTVQV
ncbi:MAG TPA: metal-dependent hydrolase [Chloroflexota bacterium]|nr:metal-dependent hydrolase [Chloroflexota bacterium]HUM68635.1 metal-dependent hydrolase [Chloroflexota bacterium]